MSFNLSTIEKMIDAGFKKIKLSPSLLGLKSANVQMPTPYGMFECRLNENSEPEYIIPEGMTVEL